MVLPLCAKKYVHLSKSVLRSLWTGPITQNVNKCKPVTAFSYKNLLSKKMKKKIFKTVFPESFLRRMNSYY